MQMTSERAVLTVKQSDGSWAVELDGEVFGRSHDKEVCKASANKRARQILDSGRPCQVRIDGEAGFFDAGRGAGTRPHRAALAKFSLFPY